jgi:hypothetical protein
MTVQNHGEMTTRDAEELGGLGDGEASGGIWGIDPIEFSARFHSTVTRDMHIFMHSLCKVVNSDAQIN